MCTYARVYLVHFSNQKVKFDMLLSGGKGRIAKNFVEYGTKRKGKHESELVFTNCFVCLLHRLRGH